MGKKGQFISFTLCSYAKEQQAAGIFTVYNECRKTYFYWFTQLHRGGGSKVF